MFATYYWRHLQDSNWRSFFKKNGVRVWSYLRFSGFKESQSDLTLWGQWHGRTNTGDLYSVMTSIDTESNIWEAHGESGRNNFALSKQQIAKDRIDTFLNPECRCRLGFHWKCGIHHRWLG
jgi:hypothetical protein